MLLSLRSQLNFGVVRARSCACVCGRERESEGRGEVSFNTSMKIPAFTSSPRSFPTGPIQVPLGISSPEVRAAAQWTGSIHHHPAPSHTYINTYARAHNP